MGASFPVMALADWIADHAGRPLLVVSGSLLTTNFVLPVRWAPVLPQRRPLMPR